MRRKSSRLRRALQSFVRAPWNNRAVGELLLRRIRRARGLEAGESWPDAQSAIVVELTVVAICGPEDLPVAARRTFVLSCEDGEPRVRPRTVDTR